MKTDKKPSSRILKDLQAFFLGEREENLPLTFAFGEPVNAEKVAFEMATTFNGEETMTGVNGGYDTGA